MFQEEKIVVFRRRLPISFTGEAGDEKFLLCQYWTILRYCASSGLLSYFTLFEGQIQGFNHLVDRISQLSTTSWTDSGMCSGLVKKVFTV